MTFLKNSVNRGKGGGIMYREIGLKVCVIIAMREAFNWMCCNRNKEHVEVATQMIT